MSTNKEQKLRDLKIKFLNIKDISDLRDDQLDILFDNEKKRLKQIEMEQKLAAKQAPDDLDKTSDKYKAILKLTNDLLKNMNKPLIKDLVEFSNIDRFDIVNEKNIKLFESLDNDEEFWTHFNKNSCGYNKKGKYWITNVFRYFIKDIGLNIIVSKKEMTEKINGVSYKRTHYIYTIK